MSALIAKNFRQNMVEITIFMVKFEITFAVH